MEKIEHFPAWEKIAEYFENSTEELILRNANIIDRLNYEELLNNETYQLWKLLKQL